MRVSRKIAKRKRREGPEVTQIVNHEEVWALCPRRPPPGWRIVGRFQNKGVFVALRAFDKSWLVKNYDRGSEWVIEDWNELFPNEEPYKAATIEDYFRWSCQRCR